jgi:hypothetical protein
MNNNNNNNNTWQNVIRGRAFRNGKMLEYKLNTLAVRNTNSNNDIFDYSVHPVALTVTEKFLPEDYSPSQQTQQKVASSISSQIDAETRKERIRAA